MTRQQMNEAIATAIGWKHNEIEWWIGDGNDSQWEAPDFCGDLNAMHGALLTLTPDQWVLFGRHLKAFPVFLATAEEHAEAFLRTLGLYTDDSNDHNETTKKGNDHD